MAENRIKEIPVVQLHNRYKIHMDQGYIYTRKGGSIMPTYERDGDTYVKLIPEGCSDEVEFSVTELVMNTIYGYTGLMPSVNVIGLPFNAYSIYPIPRPIQEVTPRDRLTDIIIGDLLYKRWNGSKYFVNKYGAIFSEPYGAFVKQNFNDRDYRLVSIGKKSVRVHRIVWEAWNERVEKLIILMDFVGIMILIIFEQSLMLKIYHLSILMYMVEIFRWRLES